MYKLVNVNKFGHLQCVQKRDKFLTGRLWIVWIMGVINGPIYPQKRIGEENSWEIWTSPLSLVPELRNNSRIAVDNIVENGDRLKMACCSFDKGPPYNHVEFDRGSYGTHRCSNRYPSHDPYTSHFQVKVLQRAC